MKSFALLSAIILASAVIGVAICHATTVHVPADQPTIQAGIDVATDGDTILVAPGTYYEHLLVDKLLVLISEAGADETTIDGQGLADDSMSSVITITNAGKVHIHGFTISGGRGLMAADLNNARGGGIYSTKTDLDVEECVIQGNWATIIDLDDQAIGGGGIYADSSTRLTIANSQISSNAVAEGGVIHDNGAFGGGGVFAICDSIEIIDCTISHNSVYTESNSNASGGGLLLRGDYCAIDQCAIDSNTATHFYNTASGGGIYVEAGYVSLTDCEIGWNMTEWNGIDGNSTAQGGGIYAITGDLLIKSCSFLINQSSCRGLHGGSSAGGGIYAISNIYNIDSSLFSGNKAITNINTSTSHTGGNAEGGAIHISGSGSLRNSIVMNSRCEAIIGSGITCRGSVFGGGLWGGSQVIGCVFYGNICNAETGGADEYEEVSCYGGGIYGSPVISETIIDSCVAKASGYGVIPNVDGGGIMTENPGAVSCSDFWNNVPNHVSGAWNPETNQNFIANPLFCPNSSDFSIFDISPCVPENNPCSTLIGAGPVACFGKPTVDTLAIYGETMSNVVSHEPVLNWSFFCPLGNPEDSFTIAVGTDADWEYAEMWNPAPFTGPDTSITYAGVGLIDGQTYYLRLCVHNGLAWSDWYEMSFRMNSKPTVPVLLSPIMETTVNDAQPILYVQNSTDAEGDPLAYIYHIYDADYGLELTTSEPVAQQPDSTGWMVDITLADNTRYVWTAEATDGYESSDIGDLPSFWVNSEESFPAAFDLIWPPDTGWSQVYDFPTTFRWRASSDPDPLDSVYYRLKIAIDSDFTFTATYDSIYQANYAVPSLEYGRHYWWKVSAIDTKGNTTPSSGVADFMTWILGDADADFTVDIGDAVFLINYIFKGGAAPFPLKAGDINPDCTINIGDAVHLINYIFRGGPPPGIGCAE